MHRALLGPAGSGKTTRARESKDAVLTSTTGISARQLGNEARTIHSLLRFYNRETFEDVIASGRAARVLQRIPELIIDEISMFQADMLDALLGAASEAGTRVTLTGDFCQLPPVPDKHPTTRRNLPWTFAFEGTAWSNVAVEVLTKSYRQQDPAFVDVLNHMRRGQAVADGLDFSSALDMNFPGITIFARNDLVDAFNDRRLGQLAGEAKTFTPQREGQQDRDWVDIRPITLKVGASVMVTWNLASGDAVNGDRGEVVRLCDSNAVVRLLDGREVAVGLLTRTLYAPGTEVEARRAFEEMLDIMGDDEDPQALAEACKARDAVLAAGALGTIRYLPVRLAWALTVHKTQGLTLDNVQVSLRESFMSQPGMVYVACSRVRRCEDLRLVGSPLLLRAHCTMHPKVVAYV